MARVVKVSVCDDVPSPPMPSAALSKTCPRARVCAGSKKALIPYFSWEGEQDKLMMIYNNIGKRALKKDKYNRKAESTNLKINKSSKGGQLIAKLSLANTFHD